MEPAVKESSQGAFFMWHGLTVRNALRLLLMRPPMDVSRLPKMLLTPPLVAFNSVMAAAEEGLHGRRIRNTTIESPPLFVLGFWRSGTTLLQNLISQDPQFCFANYYQCLFPHHFLLTERVISRLTRRLMPPTRPMDNVPAGWDMPQEDEIGLCVLSLASYYLLTVFQNDLSKSEKFLDNSGASAEELRAWKSALDYFVRKLTYKHRKPVLLKSPSHTYKIPQLLELFPDARFVHIVRNPYAAFISAIHLRKRMYEENGLCRPNLAPIENLTFTIAERAYAIYERDKELIPAGRLVETRYEDLERDPLTELERVYSGLNLSGYDELRDKLMPQLPQLRRYKKNRFQANPDLMHRVYERLRFVFDQYGYPSPLEEVEVLAA